MVGREALLEETVSVIACGAVLLAFRLSLAAVIDLAAAGHHATRGSRIRCIGLERRFERRSGQDSCRAVRGGQGDQRCRRVPENRTGPARPASAIMLWSSRCGLPHHVYSTIHGPRRGVWAVFNYLNLSRRLMLILVLANNFCSCSSDGRVGLCSYL